MVEIVKGEKIYKIVDGEEGKFRIKEVDEFGSTKGLLPEVFDTHPDATDFIKKLESGEANSSAGMPEADSIPKSEQPRADQVAPESKPEGGDTGDTGTGPGEGNTTLPPEQGASAPTTDNPGVVPGPGENPPGQTEPDPGATGAQA